MKSLRNSAEGRLLLTQRHMLKMFGGYNHWCYKPAVYVTKDLMLQGWVDNACNNMTMFSLLHDEEDYIIDGLSPKEVYQQLIDYDREFEQIIATPINEAKGVLYVNAKNISKVSPTNGDKNAILTCTDGSFVTYPLFATGYDTLVSELTLRKGDYVEFDDSASDYHP